MTRIARLPSPGQSGAFGQVRLTEAQFQRQVVGLARTFRWDIVAHFPSVLTASERYWPDLTLVRSADRRLIFAELKSDTGKLTDGQAAELEILRSLETPPAVDPGPDLFPTIQVVVWRPSDWAEIEKELR